MSVPIACRICFEEAAMPTNRSIFSGMGVAAILSLGAAFGACTSPAGQSSIPNDGPEVVELSIGPEGGTLTASDGSSIQIPPGALAVSTVITMTATVGVLLPDGATAVGMAYTLAPEGLQFARPVTVVLAFDATTLSAGAQSSQVVVYTSPVATTSYTILGGTLADSAHVSATTTHFSVFVAGVPAAGHGQVDAGETITDAGMGCVKDSVRGANKSCSASMPCTSLVGTLVASCSDIAGGYDAECCPIPVAVDGGNTHPGYPVVSGNYLRAASNPSAHCNDGRTIHLMIAPTGGTPLSVVQSNGALTIGIMTGAMDMSGNATLTSGSTSALTGTYDGTTTTVGGPITETGTFFVTPSRSFGGTLTWKSTDRNCVVSIPDSWAGR